MKTLEDWCAFVFTLVLFAAILLFTWWEYGATKKALQEKYHCEPSWSTVVLEMTRRK